MLAVYAVQTKPIGWELLLIQRGSRVTGSLWEEPWAEGARGGNGRIVVK